MAPRKKKPFPRGGIPRSKKPKPGKLGPGTNRWGDPIICGMPTPSGPCPQYGFPKCERHRNGGGAVEVGDR